jgi:protein-tyrosine phosphatase
MNFSRITDDLYIGSAPAASDYDRLRDLGIKLVINMRFWPPLPKDSHEQPLDFLWLRTFDNPLLPIPIRALREGAQAALDVIRDGGKVLTHCQHGRHRGVAMGAAVLIAQGHSLEETIKLIKTRRPIAEPDIFYIYNRILRFARQWQAAG